MLYSADFRGAQPYKLVLIGEKSSLEPVLGPLAGHQADLYLPTGEPSDTMLHQMAKTGAADGRPMVVLYFTDCDPSGWQMPISVGRKLQAFPRACSPALSSRFTGSRSPPIRSASTACRRRRSRTPRSAADKWRPAMGVAQTEIDTLASLQPDLLRQIARDAIAPFYDLSWTGGSPLPRRVADRAREMIAASFDLDRLAEIRADAESQLDQMREQIRELNDALRVDVEPTTCPRSSPQSRDERGGKQPPVDRLAVGRSPISAGR